jgi:2-polyprenyl-3-methyl-5-hydroxy-6-metoxy-1,4-benzoquinol methylase
MALTTDRPPFDQQRAEAFGERLTALLNDAFSALCLSLGHQTGLFDTMADLPAASSADIARAAHLDERYVREWLGAMSAAGIVVYDPAARTYHLPAEHAATLTRAAGPDNLAVMAQFVSLLASAEQPVAGCFRSGGGVPYSEYTEFHRLMAEESARVFDAALVDRIVPLVPGLSTRLEEGIDVADVGCGSGHAVNVAAQAYPASRFTGYDFSEEALGAARREASALGLANTNFELRDVAALDEADRFDLVTAFDAIHDQAHPAAVLAGIATALRPDGVFLMADIRASSDLADNVDHPLGPMLYTISLMHCMTVSLALGGDGLGTVWGRQLAEQMLADAGFTSVEVQAVEGDLLNDYFIARRS